MKTSSSIEFVKMYLDYQFLLKVIKYKSKSLREKLFFQYGE